MGRLLTEHTLIRSFYLFEVILKYADRAPLMVYCQILILNLQAAQKRRGNKFETYQTQFKKIVATFALSIFYLLLSSKSSGISRGLISGGA